MSNHAGEGTRATLAKANQLTHSFRVGKNLGGLRPWIVCSSPNAIFSRVGSLHARPKNEIPTGKPKTNPAGTVISG